MGLMDSLRSAIGRKSARREAVKVSVSPDDHYEVVTKLGKVNAVAQQIRVRKRELERKRKLGLRINDLSMVQIEKLETQLQRTAEWLHQHGVPVEAIEQAVEEGSKVEA